MKASILRCADKGFFLKVQFWKIPSGLGLVLLCSSFRLLKYIYMMTANLKKIFFYFKTLK